MPQPNVIFLDSSRQNAPTLAGQANSLNNLLYQVLCTGFNSQTTTSVTRSGTTVTVTKAGHGFKTYDWVLMGGFTPADYNGTWVVTGYTTDAFTFTIAGTPGSASVQGTVAFSPLGWTRDYNSGNKSVYHGDDQSSLLPLYVDDSGAIGSQSYRVAWFNGFESWAGGVGTNAWPTVAQQANGLCWNKSSTVDSTARAWFIRGDGKRFLFGTFWHASYLTTADVFCFGDYLPTIPGNAFPGFIIGSFNDTQSYPGVSNTFSYLQPLGTPGNGKFLCRKYDGTGSAIAFGMMGNNAVSANMGWGGLPGTNPATSGYEITPVDIHAGASLAVASFYSPLPGVYHLLHDQLFTSGDFLPTMPDLPNRRLIVYRISNGSAVGRLVLDITGPDQ